jgi:hypothetical protein
MEAREFQEASNRELGTGVTNHGTPIGLLAAGGRFLLQVSDALMNATPESPREPQESELLVPFESEHIPADYKEYYKTKRNNLFASIQRFPEMWEYYIRLDAIWLREFDDLKPPGQVKQWFPLILFFNAHAKIRVSIELVLSGCLAEARSILRDAIECVAHAHTMLRDPQLQTVWLSKNEEEQAFADAFERSKKQGHLQRSGRTAQ